MSSATPLVSIVIPAYNHADYLDQAIQSVLSQDWNDIELIVLNDGSTDNTRNVLQKYTGRFYWETQENMGQANTLNKGWRIAKGEILSYLSADDVLMLNAVSTSVRHLLSNPKAVLVYCDFNLISPDSSVVRRVRTPEFNYRDMLVKLACPPGPGAFFRRSGYEKAGGWDGSLRQMPDYEYWLKLALHGPFLHIPEVLAGFRVHEKSQTFAQTSIERAEEPVKIVHRFFDNSTLPAEITGLREQALSNAYLVSAQLDFRAGRYGVGYAKLKRAFSLCWKNLLAVSTLRLILNGLFNRLGYVILWKIGNLIHKKN